MAKYSKVQKQSWRKGLLKGIKIGNKRKKRNSFSVNDKDYVLAGEYARHMGIKFGLFEKEIARNHHSHYRQAKKDKSFRTFLRREYG